MPRLSVLIAAWFAVIASCATSAADRGVPADGRYDIGGRSLRLSCQGRGWPTVVVDAGMGTAPVEDPAWRGIASRIAPVTRICLYDRAGLGGSDPAPQVPRTSLDAARDLHAVLAKARETGPFLLVGHSIGGLHAQVFAVHYPASTAGLVLVSSTHPDQFAKWLALLPPPAPDEGKPLSDGRAFLVAMASDPTANPEHLDMRASVIEARALISLGDKPVIVATHSPRFRMAPGLSESIAIKLEGATQQMQRQFLGLSTNAHQNIAATAGHELPHEAPAFVVDNILQGVAAVRDKRPAVRR